MDLINNMEEMKQTINDNSMAILYFSGETCGACGVIKKKVEQILTAYPRIVAKEIMAEEYIDLAAQCSVFSVPVLLFYIEGKETLRVGRNVDVRELEEKLNRYYAMIYK